MHLSMTRSPLPVLCLCAVLCASVLTPRSAAAATDHNPPIACGSSGTPSTAAAGTVTSATSQSSTSALYAALYAMFGLGNHPGCQDCPPEKPQGCSAVTSHSRIEVSSVENPDGTWTYTITAGEGASSFHRCYECYGEGEL
jgi:hypothetical protein